MRTPEKQDEDTILERVRRFLQRPPHEKSRSIYARWKRVFPTFPYPIRLPFDAWFIARNDYLGSTLTFDGFEPAERAFVQRFVQPGMTVLDIGAHHGFYTLLASKLVGPNGRIYAFEPSPRERKALRLNLRLNRCKNVSVEGFALAGQDSQGILHVVDQWQTGCNSLEPPAADVTSTSTSVSIQVRRLDTWVLKKDIRKIDFIKLDVEGAELEVLRGTGEALRTILRPVLLCELQDVRTAVWGYKPKDAALYLSKLGYKWFHLGPGGSLVPAKENDSALDGNFVAVPDEQVSQTTETFSRKP